MPTSTSLSRLLAICGSIWLLLPLLLNCVDADPIVDADPVIPNLTTTPSIPTPSITIHPPVLASSTVYTVQWKYDPEIFIAGLQIVPAQASVQDRSDPAQVIITTQQCILNDAPGSGCTGTLSDFSSTTFTASASITPTGDYILQLFWATNSSPGGSLNTATATVPGTLPTSSSTILATSNPGFTATAAATPTESLNPGPPGPTISASDVPTSSPVTSNSPESSSGLSTGAKVGIAIGAIGAVLIAIIVALLLWRRSRQRKARALPTREMPYTHDLDSTNRDLTAEKEMNVVSSPVDSRHTGFTGLPGGAQPISRSQSNSWDSPEERSAAGEGAGAIGPYSDSQRHSHGSGHDEAAAQSAQSPATGPTTSAVQRKPVGAATSTTGVGAPDTTHHLREPGMSDVEVARLEEEERRLDEAIAEAERRRGE